MALSKVSKENHFQLQPSSDVQTEVVDEAKVRPFEHAEPVSDSLVEIVEENVPNKPQKGTFNKHTLVVRNSTVSVATSKSPRKPNVKKIQKFTKGRLSSSKSKIVTRVSIPGKHRPFNSSRAWPNSMHLLGNLPQTFSSLKHSSHGGIVLTNKINLADKARKRIYQDERNRPSFRDILHVSISRMGLDKNSSRVRMPSPSIAVNARMSQRPPFKSVLPIKKNTDLSKKTTLQNIATDKGEIVSVIKGRPKSVSQTPQSPSTIKGLPFRNKVKNIQQEPEVYDGLTNKNLVNDKKHLFTKGGQKSEGNKSNLTMLTSKVSTGRNQSGQAKLSNKTYSNSQMSPKIAQSNTVRPQVKSNTSLHKSGNGRDLPKIKPNDKIPIAHRNSTRDGHVLSLLHHEINATFLNNTKLSIKHKAAYAFPLDSKITKHFHDLISFFNSFNSSSIKNVTTNTTVQQRNWNFTNGAKIKMRHRIMVESLHRILGFIRNRKRPRANYTGKLLGLKKEQTHSNHSFISEHGTKRLQMSIYKGWNEVNKRKGFKGTIKGSPLPNLSMMSNHASSNHTVPLLPNNDLKNSTKDTFDKNLLQLMRNASQKELLKLEGDIINALSFARLWNLSQPNEKQGPQQHHGISFNSDKNSEKYQQKMNGNNYKQEHHKQEEPKYQHHKQQQLQNSSENTFEETQLQMMRNASQRELLELENDIIKALSHSKLLNVSKPNVKQRPGRQDQIGFKEKDEINQQISRTGNDKQDHHFKEEQKHKHRQNDFQQQQQQHHHRQPNVALHQNKTQTQKTQTERVQIKDNNITITLHKHQEEQSSQSGLQEANQSRYHLKNKSHSMDGTTRVENCTSTILNNTTTKHLGYKCYQTKTNLSSHKNKSEDSFPHSHNTSYPNTAISNKTQLYTNSTPISVFIPSSLGEHSPSRKMSGNKTSYFVTGNNANLTRPSFEEVEEKEGTKNILIHFDEDSPRDMSTQSISEGKLGSGVLEMTEFVDQGKS